jgi:isoaspartyl peptidase/L-asparaginase-like protein (Ntn-hydrolase superfamily)
MITRGNCGSVVCVKIYYRGYRLLPKKVMTETPHAMLAGAGA